MYIKPTFLGSAKAFVNVRQQKVSEISKYLNILIVLIVFVVMNSLFILNEKKIGIDVSAIIIDIHCEATSEKMAVGHEFDGKSSLIVGTHTHIPTADSRILENGTAYISDLGMCGDYNSIIGMDKNKALERFKKKIPVKGINPSTGEATLSSVLVEVDDRTGLAKSIQQIIIGGSLKEIM